MTERFDHPISRRRMLRQLLVVAGAASSLPIIGHTGTASAAVGDAGKKKKSDVQYQNHPRGKSACENCGHFIPADDPEAMGQCTIVAGEINPHGWCLAYTSNS